MAFFNDKKLGFGGVRSVNAEPDEVFLGFVYLPGGQALHDDGIAHCSTLFSRFPGSGNDGFLDSGYAGPGQYLLGTMFIQNAGLPLC